MKKITVYSILAFIVLTFLFSFIKISTAEKDNGAVGDVKFSILEPSKFRAQNGDGWILLDGGATTESAQLYTNSILKNVLQIPSLPDARGIFLRGMNMDRNTSDGNADGDVPVGTPQPDMLGKHRHDIFYYSGVHWDFPSNEYAGAVKPWSDPHPQAVIKGKPTDFEGGPETRPRNISLYIYIKIN